VHGIGKDDERRLARQCRGGREDAFEAASTSFRCKLLALRPVVGRELALGDTECVAHGLVGEVEYVDVGHAQTTDAALDLERRNLVVAPVSEQLRPCAALGERRIPRAWFAFTVIPRAVRSDRLAVEHITVWAGLPPDDVGQAARRNVCHHFQPHKWSAGGSDVSAVCERLGGLSNSFDVALGEHIEWRTTVERSVLRAEPLADAPRGKGVLEKQDDATEPVEPLLVSTPKRGVVHPVPDRSLGHPERRGQIHLRQAVGT
jgi:hypothetical protein